MATPTPPGASKRAAGGVSTPSHLNQSSPPRSVPSPVASRQPAGKTPISHATTSSTGSKTVGSTPMVHTLSQTGNTSSPGVNMLNFPTPPGLGIEGTTPLGLNVPTPAMGGTSMLPTISELGIKRNADDERRAKMRKVLKSIGQPKGRVGEEGIARISRRVGFENDIDIEKLTPEEMEKKVGNRQIGIGGKSVVIDIDLMNHVPQKVQIAFPGRKLSKNLEEDNNQASQVLLKDLSASAGIALNAKLDKFASNLEHLAKLDRLSATGVNCFEATIGLYSSLRRLYEQERVLAKGLLQAEATDTVKKADTEVICKRSGKPLMNARGMLGLSITYWKEAINSNDRKAPSVANQRDMQPMAATTEVESDIFALHIEAEAATAGLFPSLRVSDEWLPDPLQLPVPDSGEGIPWQDPPSTLLPATSNSDAMPIDGGSKLPDLRFVAKLDPPVVMPLQTAMNLFTALGAAPPSMTTVPPSYAAVLLDSGATPQAQPSATSFTLSMNRDVLSQRGGQETVVKHNYILDSAKPSYGDLGFRLDEFPFSHPRQLVELLPTFRQWASVGALLKTSLGGGASPSPERKADGGSSGHRHGASNGKMTLEDLLADSSPTASQESLPVSLTLANTPTPTLGVVFPTSRADTVANISVQIMNNAEVSVVGHSGVLSESSNGGTDQGQRLGRALEVCGDIGVWIEWMRSSMN